jgi:hypothetical protein
MPGKSSHKRVKSPVFPFVWCLRGERCFEVDWHNSHLTSLLPEEVRAYRSGKNAWDLWESTVILWWELMEFDVEDVDFPEIIGDL